MATLQEEIERQVEQEMEAEIPLASAEMTPSQKLLAACTVGDLKSAQEAVAAGANIEAREGVELNESENTALILAVKQGHTAIVNWLLSIGANGNARGWQQKTPLMFAVLHNHLEVVKCLLEWPRINVALEDQDTFTAFRLALTDTDSENAARRINFEIINMLIKANAQVGQRCGREQSITALLASWNRGDETIANLLVELGADIKLNEELFRINPYQDQWSKEMEERIASSKIYRSGYLEMAKTAGQAIASEGYQEDIAREIGKNLFGKCTLGLTEFGVGYCLETRYLQRTSPSKSCGSSSTAFTAAPSVLSSSSSSASVSSSAASVASGEEGVMFDSLWQKWKKEYNEKFPNREKSGYGPGALVIKKFSK